MSWTECPPALVLASSSPRRREMLERLGVSFEVLMPEEGVEQPLPERCPPEGVPGLVSSAALQKARHVAAHLEARRLALAADTVVTLGDELLGKPEDPEAAVRMLRRLSGRRHFVVTGVAVVEAASDREATSYERTEVTFRRLDDKDIQDYVSSGEPLDKAGAYGIQGLGGLLVKRIEGCYFNVVGLPLVRVDRLLRGFGLRLMEAARC